MRLFFILLMWGCAKPDPATKIAGFRFVCQAEFHGYVRAGMRNEIGYWRTWGKWIKTDSLYSIDKWLWFDGKDFRGVQAPSTDQFNYVEIRDGFDRVKTTAPFGGHRIPCLQLFFSR